MSSPADVQAEKQNRPDFLTELRARQARKIHRSYYAWLRLSRLAMAGFIIIGVLFMGWAIPWFPRGLSTEDYTPQLAFTLYLIGGATLLALLTVALRTLARRRQATLMAWSAVYDEKTGLYNRAYLNNLLSLECDRAKESKDEFSLLVFHVRPSSGGSALSPDMLRTLAELIRRAVRSTDVVALLSDHELAVLGFELQRKQRAALVAKVRTLIQSLLPKLVKADGIEVFAGAATYGEDGEEPGAIIQTARSAAAGDQAASSSQAA